MKRTRIRRAGDGHPVRTRVVVAAAVAAAAMTITGTLAGCIASENPTDAASVPTPSETPRTTEVPAPGGTTIDDVIETAPPGPVKDADLDDVVTLDTGMRISVTEITSITVEAETPGEVAGPAVAATIGFENESGGPLDVDGATVSLLDADGNLAVPTTSAPAAPVMGAIDDGESAEGTYVFRIPEDTRHEITLTVDYAAGAPVVVFHGSIP
ncbi:hypothetical protein LQ757_01815 [Agromyces sp. SYSU K20354]|uniref:hypothetical protein n=1 Tax=Agromyces cavernae TaxID=2898659 RepID=UPI001E45F2AD|nr:hypothetical protein [Agromyces cavernae]MCD2441002.1 hypothetical protein [Agromyces cavernae]